MSLKGQAAVVQSCGDVEIGAVRFADMGQGRFEGVVRPEQIDIDDGFECPSGQAGDGRQAATGQLEAETSNSKQDRQVASRTANDKVDPAVLLHALVHRLLELAQLPDIRTRRYTSAACVAGQAGSTLFATLGTVGFSCRSP